MSEGGRVTVPKRVRDALGWKAGDVIDFRVQGREMIVRKRDGARPRDRLLAVIADGRRTDEVMQELRPLPESQASARRT